jgi:hypothetical protein
MGHSKSEVVARSRNGKRFNGRHVVFEDMTTPSPLSGAEGRCIWLISYSTFVRITKLYPHAYMKDGKMFIGFTKKMKYMSDEEIIKNNVSLHSVQDLLGKVIYLGLDDTDIDSFLEAINSSISTVWIPNFRKLDNSTSINITPKTGDLLMISDASKYLRQEIKFKFRKYVRDLGQIKNKGDDSCKAKKK